MSFPLPPLPLLDGCLMFDNSGWVENLSTCDRRLEYSQLHKRVSSGDSMALSFGSAIHNALELRYKTMGNQTVDPFYTQSMLAILTDYFNLHPSSMEDYRTLNWAMEVMKQYNARYGDEDFSLLEYNEPIECSHCNGSGQEGQPDVGAVKSCVWCDGTGKQHLIVELSFAVELFDWVGWLPEEALGVNFPKDRILDDRIEGATKLLKVRITMIYTGRIDLPINRSGSIFILDHKTTSILGPGYFSEKKMSAQLKGYCWVFEKLTGQTVRGYAINAIRVKEPPNYVKNNELSRYGKKQSPDDWWRESLQREFFYLNEGELDEWRLNTIALVKNFFWNYSNGYMPMKTTWCVSKYGNCPYLEVCSLHPKEDRGFLLASGNFTDNVWTPLKQPTQAKTLQ